MNESVIRICAPHFTAGIVCLKQTVTQAAPIVAYMLGWIQQRVLEQCAQKGWDHSVINPDRPLMSTIIERKTFPIKLDPDRVRLPMGDLLKILDAIVDHPDKFKIIFASDLLGVGARQYLHVTAENNSKQWHLAFGVRMKMVVNCLACVTPAGKEWNIDDDDNLNVWNSEGYQKLTKMLLPEEDPGERRIMAVPHWKVCIEITPGKGDWVGFGSMYDLGPGAKQIQYPSIMHPGAVFEIQEEAEKAAEKCRIYWQDWNNLPQDEKNKIRKIKKK